MRRNNAVSRIESGREPQNVDREPAVFGWPREMLRVLDAPWSLPCSVGSGRVGLVQVVGGRDIVGRAGAALLDPRAGAVPLGVVLVDGDQPGRRVERVGVVGVIAPVRRVEELVDRRRGDVVGRRRAVFLQLCLPNLPISVMSPFPSVILPGFLKN